MQSGAGLELVDIEKRYGAKAALDAVSFTAGPGEIVSLTGPSGAGKSTTCRVISGIERPIMGAVRLTRQDVTRLPPQARNVAFMFESYALYPHLSVVQNIVSPLRSPRVRNRLDDALLARRTRDVLALTEMEDLAGRLPAELSGGQKQRVALCRALVQEPEAFLLDEPISHLDAKLRHKLRGELRRRQTAADAPTLWCTPDAMEALSVADRVVVLIDGKVQQIDTPDELYRRPANVRVARLIGDPAINLLPGRLEEGISGLVFRHGAGVVDLSGRLAAKLRARPGKGDVVLGVRPNEIEITSQADTAGFPGEVYAFEPFGKYNVVTVQLDEGLWKVKTVDGTAFDSGDPVTLSIRAKDFAVFDAVTGEAI